jgi:hypothetical protein
MLKLTAALHVHHAVIMAGLLSIVGCISRQQLLCAEQLEWKFVRAWKQL